MENKASLSLPRGWSHQKAVNMGMPHLLEDRCIICGAELDCAPHSKHHVTPKGAGCKQMTLRSKETGREYRLESSLVSVCGTGTTGCHNGLHGGAEFRMSWVWESDLLEKMWFDGVFLDEDYKPHDPRLWTMGHYDVWKRGRRIGLPEKRILRIYENAYIRACV